ncbi:hypothetical protein EV356DRAFT_453472 [Viridothelium virens]|uniref:Uncharacterized protein n=1 Tax=Viridothelium virens TaxID=1048519 RepID=A0A6A6GYH4_VIRVR|nr:hypothetical protein EV356DRAFT_453472 [Viridothelium virens]
MGILRTTTSIIGWSSLATVGTFVAWTRNSKFVPMTTTDEIFTNVIYNRLNPERNPTFHDLCIRRVPLSKIRPELLEKDGKLVEQFCAGVWSGFGYTIQRKILERLSRGPETAHQLWDREELKASSYPLGTQITDHFEVVSHSPSAIMVRCGDSPKNSDVRETDGLFEMRAEVKEAEGVAEFQLKSCFYQGLGKSDTGAPPINAAAGWLHQLYTKLWMESALRNVVR